MIGTVRFIGLLNAAIWLGAGLFAWAGAGRVVTSDAMQHLLTAKHYPYFSGVIGQMIADKYWNLHLACALIALLHAAAESLYFGKVIPKLWLGVLLGFLAIGISEKAVVQPALKRLHLAAHAVNRPVAERRAAAARHGTWSSISGVLEFATLLGLGIYLWRVANPPDPTRFLTPGMYRG